MAREPDEALHRKQCKRYNIAGHVHYLTFSCFRRQPFLTRDRTREWLAEAIIAAREKHSFRLIAYVFMPEHAHLLIHPRKAKYDISTILHSVKLPVGRKARAFVIKEAPEFLEQMRVGPADGPLQVRFWQAGGGYDRNIYSPEEFCEKLGYIHRNPVKRKLVTREVDWKWSSAADYAKVRVGPLPVDNEDLSGMW